MPLTSGVAGQLPDNLSYLSPVAFKFQLKKIPHVTYFCQAANLPGISVGETVQPTPFHNIPIPGDHVVYETLNVRFIVDEELRTWMELHNWITGIGFPKSFDQYAELAASSTTPGISGVYSDATLIVLSGAMNPQIEVTFTDCFPVTLTEVLFDSTLTDVEYVTADCTFNYKTYSIKRLIGDTSG
jgi:hypothetical protein|tara:strand:+ start:6636 stop:7190 length:555 start_codon:yes stop_codon:yes gene_type:complete